MVLNALLPSNEEEGGKEKTGGLSISSEVLECYFLTALYLSLGAALIEESRKVFDTYVKKLACLTDVPGDGAVAGPGEIPIHYPTLYEYYFDPEKSKWVPWADKVPDYEHKAGLKFHEILVPTVDTMRNTWLLELMVKIRRPVVFVGETGTSKTATIQNFLRKLDPDTTVRHLSLKFNFLRGQPNFCPNPCSLNAALAECQLFVTNNFDGCPAKFGSKC